MYVQSAKDNRTLKISRIMADKKDNLLEILKELVESG